MYPFNCVCSNKYSLQIPLGELGDLSTECKPKPHKHIALGFCRKQQVDTVIFIVSLYHSNHSMIYLGLQLIWTLLHVGRLSLISGPNSCSHVLHGEYLFRTIST